MDLVTLQELLVDSLEQSQPEILINDKTLTQVEAFVYVVNANNSVRKDDALTQDQLLALSQHIGQSNQLSGNNVLAASYILDDQLSAQLISNMSEAGTFQHDHNSLKALVNLVCHANMQASSMLLEAINKTGGREDVISLDFTQPYIEAIEAIMPKNFADKRITPEESLVGLMEELPWDGSTISDMAELHDLEIIRNSASKRIANEVKENTLSTVTSDSEYVSAITVRQSL